MTLTCFHRIIFIINLGGWHYHQHHFKEDKTEAQGGLVTCPRSQSKEVESWDLNLVPEAGWLSASPYT